MFALPFTCLSSFTVRLLDMSYACTDGTQLGFLASRPLASEPLAVYSDVTENTCVRANRAKKDGPVSVDPPGRGGA